MAKSISITDFKILSKLFAKHQDRNEARSDLRQVYALDTETDENGNITVLADSDGNSKNPDTALKRGILSPFQA